MNNIEIGKILKNGLFYRLENEEKTNFVKNTTFYSVLHGDTVSYIHTPSGVVIREIIDRKSQMTLCLVYNNRIRLPFLSDIYNIPIAYTSHNHREVMTYLGNVNKNGVTLLENLGNISDRSEDARRLSCLYTSIKPSDLFDKLQSTSIIGESYYTKKEVVDLRHLQTFNIDPKHSKDFDDAISVDIENNKVYIHIVDINYLIQDKLEDEKRAFDLGYTLYMGDLNVNMFPKMYSENKFSLIKDEDRYVISIEMTFENNIIKEYEIYRSIIQIKERYDYENSQQALENGDEKMVYLENLVDSNNLTTSKINIPSRKLEMKDHVIKDIRLEYMKKTNKIIEALMITTNKIVTKHLQNVNVPQRYHPPSNIENSLENLDLHGSIDIIRKYKLAKYSVKDNGHFGLNLEYYTHFTSPIRRCSDILVHKILGGVIYDDGYLEEMIAYLNEREKLNEQLSKFYDNCKLYEYFSQSNKNFNARVYGISKFGIHILIEEIMFRDFIHISAIDEKIRWEYENKILFDSSDKSRMIKENTIIPIEIMGIDWFKMKVSEYQLSLSHITSQ